MTVCILMMMQRKNITELLFNSVLSTLKSRNSFFFSSSFTFHGKIHDASVNRHRIKNLYDAFTSPILNVLAIPEQTSRLTFFFSSSL